MNKFISSLIIMLVAYLSCANAQTSKYENLDGAVNLLSSYYDAVNRKDYRRAYSYWETPTEAYENFVKGYAATEKVRLIVEPPNSIGAATGSLYVEIPTVLIATQKGGTQQTFAGCYTMRKSNLRSPDIPKEDVWHIYRASLNPAPVDAEIPPLLAKSCAENTNTPTDNPSSRILGALSFDSKELNDAITAPETIEVNQDFQVTITTSGGGCVSAGDTGVVLTETSADVFVYDLTTANRPGIVCTLILKRLPHNATLRFTKRGEAMIRVWGRRQGGTSPLGEPVVIERRVTVK